MNIFDTVEPSKIVANNPEAKLFVVIKRTEKYDAVATVTDGWVNVNLANSKEWPDEVDYCNQKRIGEKYWTMVRNERDILPPFDDAKELYILAVSRQQIF